MQKTKLFDDLLEEFLHYLSGLNLPKKTLKVYKLDLNHFLDWLDLKLKSLGVFIESFSEALPYINSSLLSEYASYLSANTTAPKKNTRRVGLVKYLSEFLHNKELISQDFGTSIKVKQIKYQIKHTHSSLSKKALVSEFQRYLEGKNMSKNTVKSYMSDIKQFMDWLDLREN